MTTGVFGSGELTPRNIIWVEDIPPDSSADDSNHLTASYFTHAIVSFFHLDAGPTLVYNGPGNDPYQPKYDAWRSYLRGLRQAGNPRTLFLSVLHVPELGPAAHGGRPAWS